MTILKRIFNRLRLAIEITVLCFMLYSVIRTILGIEMLTEGGITIGGFGFKKYITNFVLWFGDYFLGFDQIKKYNYGYYIFEIVLLIMPTLIIALAEVYRYREKIFKNYTIWKQKLDEKKLRKYEEKIKQLKGE